MGERIRKVRVAWGWSQVQLSESLSVPQQAVSSWERDLTRPSGPALGALAALFRLPAEALMEGKGFQIPAPLMEEVALVATEKGRKRKPVELPKAKPGEVWGVDLETSEHHPLKLEEAIALLRKAAKEGTSIWMVLKK